MDGARLAGAAPFLFSFVYWLTEPNPVIEGHAMKPPSKHRHPSLPLLAALLFLSACSAGAEPVPGVQLMPVEEGPVPDEAALLFHLEGASGQQVLEYRYVRGDILTHRYIDLLSGKLLRSRDLPRPIVGGTDPETLRRQEMSRAFSQATEAELGLRWAKETSPALPPASLATWRDAAPHPEDDPGFGEYGTGKRVLAPVTRELCLVAPLVLRVQEPGREPEIVSLIQATPPGFPFFRGAGCPNDDPPGDPAPGHWQVPIPAYYVIGGDLRVGVSGVLALLDPVRLPERAVVTRIGATLLIARGPGFVEAYARALGLHRDPGRCLSLQNLPACRQDQDRFLRAWFGLR